MFWFCCLKVKCYFPQLDSALNQNWPWQWFAFCTDYFCRFGLVFCYKSRQFFSIITSSIFVLFLSCCRYMMRSIAKIQMTELISIFDTCRVIRTYDKFILKWQIVFSISQRFYDHFMDFYAKIWVIWWLFKWIRTKFPGKPSFRIGQKKNLGKMNFTCVWLGVPKTSSMLRLFRVKCHPLSENQGKIPWENSFAWNINFS